MGPRKPLPRLELLAAIASLVLILLLGALRQLALHAGIASVTAGLWTRIAVLLLFLVFAFSAIGLMLHVFIVLQIRIGNAAAPMVHLFASHETGITLLLWTFLGLGTLVAMPFIWTDLIGWPSSPGKSHGLLVADIGMTIDQVKQRSTLKFKEPRVMGDGSRMGVADVVFDYQIGDSTVVFPQSRYYWLETPKGDPHIHVLNIGITPQKMPLPNLEAFQHKLQSQLLADGWMPGHYLAKTEDTVRLWGGRHTAGDGRYWTRGPTLLIFETSRMDERKSDEPPGSGEFILNIALRPRDHDRDLVFEPSAWSR